MSNNVCAASPSRSASEKASHTAIIETPRIILLQIFAAAMMLKDLRLAQQAAGATAAPTPLGAAAANLYQLFADEGAGSLDFSAIYRFIRKPDRKI